MEQKIFINVNDINNIAKKKKLTQLQYNILQILNVTVHISMYLLPERNI